MVLRGKKIEHHNIINDLMLKNQIIYKPAVGDGLPKDMHVTNELCLTAFYNDACALIS